MKLISMIASEVGASTADIERLARTAPFRYKTYTIPKRNGGERLIAHPTPAVKLLQRTVVKILQAHWIPHEAAKAYVENGGIKANALPHAPNSHILKLDFHNFFNSITPAVLKEFMERHPIEPISSEEDFSLLVNITFWARRTPRQLCLSVGAPSSPYLSNIVLKPFDSDIEAACYQFGVTYTRYADDLTFSGTSFEQLNRAKDFVLEWLRRTGSHHLQINREKTTFISKKFQRRITGVTITNDGRLSVGRTRKRNLRAAIHRYALGNLPQEELQKLKGMLAFVNDIEPNYLSSLARTFGEDVINRIRVNLPSSTTSEGNSDN